MRHCYLILSILIVKGSALTVAGTGRHCFNSNSHWTSRDRNQLASVSESISPDVESVHLQLNKKSAEIEVEADEHEVEDVSGLISMYEYVRVNDSTVLLAAVETKNGPFEIEIFSAHVFGSNYTAMEGITLNKKTVNITDQGLMKTYIDLWQSGLLISQNRDFPIYESTSDQLTPGPEVFRGQVSSLVRRFKHLIDDRERAGNSYSDFLISQDLHSKFQRNESLSRNETLASLKEFSVWFRSQFPYYYHQCSFCDKKDDNFFYGLVTPTPYEQGYQAGRTELYFCTNVTCAKTFRFPRYNDVTKVLETRKGRCGEYSVLMMRFLEELGYDSKWVVDWADHVWCEVFVDDDIEKKNSEKKIFQTLPQLPLISKRKPSKWVHLDPCEAAVGENFIYQSWGKAQNYIVAVSKNDMKDVTEFYTTKYNETVSRRLESGVNQTYVDSLLKQASEEIKNYTRIER